MNNILDIILATFNGEKYLEEQLDSLLLQTYQNFRILIRDDGSNDGTIKIIFKYKELHPNKIFLIQDDFGNLGSSKSFMKLLNYSEAKYIMFCDQDDVWLHNKIELSLSEMFRLESEYPQNTPLLLFTDLMVVDKNLNLLSPSFWIYQKLDPIWSNSWKMNLAQNVVTGCTMLINKQAKKVCLPYNSKFMIHDQWIAINVAINGKVHYINSQTILYRQHEKNVAGAHQYGFIYILKKLINIKKIFISYYEFSTLFEGCSFLKLIGYKILINIKRLNRNRN